MQDVTEKIFALGYHMCGAGAPAVEARDLASAAVIFRHTAPDRELHPALEQLPEPLRLWLLLTRAEGFSEAEAVMAMGRPPELPEELPCPEPSASDDHLVACYSCLCAHLERFRAPVPARPVNPFAALRRKLGVAVLCASLVWGAWFSSRVLHAQTRPLPELVEQAHRYLLVPNR